MRINKKGQKVYQNSVRVEGYLYEHKLELKTTGEQSKNPGTQYITGTVSVATDDEMTNIVQVYYRYVTATFGASGKPNETFGHLKSIIDGSMKSVMAHGKEVASKIRIDSAIALNDWYDARNNNELVSVKRNEGGFIHPVSELGPVKDRSSFNVDMVITGVTHVDADDERNRPEKVVLKGAIFDYRPSLLPVEFNVYGSQAMGYFESLGATNSTPVFTRVTGVEISKTVVRKVEEEGAFGDPVVKEFRNTQRDFVVNWAQSSPYQWDDPSTITAVEFSEMIANREVYLADTKRRQDEYNASRGSAFAAPTPAAAASTGVKYDF